MPMIGFTYTIKSFTCKVCDAKFSMKNNLKCHMLTHTGYMSIKCDVSHMLFRPSGNRAGAQLSKCEVCRAAFSKNGNLKFNMHIHTGGRPFKCKECNAAFNKNGSLNMHMRTHTGERPFKYEQL